MNTFLALATMTLWYYFIIMSVIKKEPKSKIMNIAFTTWMFTFLIVIISFIDLLAINIVLFILYYILANWFYTDFAFFVKIQEYFLKRKDLTKQSQESIRYSLLKVIVLDLTTIKDNLYSLITKRNLAIDIIAITYGFILWGAYLLHILNIVDIWKLFI